MSWTVPPLVGPHCCHHRHWPGECATVCNRAQGERRLAVPAPAPRLRSAWPEDPSLPPPSSQSMLASGEGGGAVAVVWGEWGSTLMDPAFGSVSKDRVELGQPRAPPGVLSCGDTAEDGLLGQGGRRGFCTAGRNCSEWRATGTEKTHPARTQLLRSHRILSPEVREARSPGAHSGRDKQAGLRPTAAVRQGGEGAQRSRLLEPHRPRFLASSVTEGSS